MSSMASPTTTTRQRAILASSASIRSRGSRVSAAGLISGEGGLLVDAIADADRADESRLRHSGHVVEITHEMHAPVAGHAKASELPAPADREPHDAFHHSLQQDCRRGILGDERMRQTGIALALP